MYFYLVLDGNPLCSFLTLQAALEAALPLLLEGRNAQVIRMKEWCASALARPLQGEDGAAEFNPVELIGPAGGEPSRAE